MICPKCGTDNDTEDERCPECGIFYIKWIIARFRAKKTKPHSSRSPLPRRLWPYALAAGFTAGIIGSRLLREAPLPELRDPYAPVAIPVEIVRDRIADIAQEARTIAEQSGLRIHPSDFSGYFKQGADSFDLGNLLLAAREEGRPRPMAAGVHEELTGLETRPIKCLRAGEWTYFDSAPRTNTGIQECWSAVRTPRRETIHHDVYYDVQWDKIDWAAEKAQWAYFTREDDRRLFQRHIAKELGENAEREDIAESKKLIRDAGKNPTLLKAALMTSFRTRVRREGARYRLELISD